MNDPSYNKHIEVLESIVRNSVSNQGDWFEGNCVYEHLTFNKKPDYIQKQKNLMRVAKTAKSGSIIEIGFNAGHSALLFLLSNPDIVMYCFDICLHKYTKECFYYLRNVFPNRISLIVGDSTVTIPAFSKLNFDIKISVIHIDGCHHLMCILKDIVNCYDLLSSSTSESATLILDDTNQEYIMNVWKSLVDTAILTKQDYVGGDHEIGTLQVAPHNT